MLKMSKPSKLGPGVANEGAPGFGSRFSYKNEIYLISGLHPSLPPLLCRSHILMHEKISALAAPWRKDSTP